MGTSQLGTAAGLVAPDRTTADGPGDGPEIAPETSAPGGRRRSGDGGQVSGRADADNSIVRQIFRPIGWGCIAIGLLLIEFAAFLVWGTGMKTAAAQADLRREFASVGGSERVLVAPRPNIGDPVARLIIPRLGLDAIVVEGVSFEDLVRGPGHIPETAFPGTDGSSVISGHRTTYGAPFADADKLEAGDEIRIQTVEGESAYLVTRSYTVLPDDTSVTLPLGPGERPRLRLTTCHPRFSAARRLIVEADRVEPPGPFETAARQ